MTARSRRRGRAGSHRVGSERGLTMIELVVAVSVFAILAGGLALTIDSGLNLARNNRNRSIAANLASQEMDKVRQETFTSLPLGLVDRTESVDGVDYTVRRESEWVDNDVDHRALRLEQRDAAGAAGVRRASSGRTCAGSRRRSRRRSSARRSARTTRTTGTSR